MLTISKHSNKTSEASESALQIHGGHRFNVVSKIDRSKKLEVIYEYVNKKHPAQMQKMN